MSLWVTSDSVELRSGSTEEELQDVIRAVYRQVLGNQHVLDSDRLSSSEALLRNGDITVRGFVRAVGHSALYRSLFFNCSSAYRFAELNARHFLGRPPCDQAEISEHVGIYNSDGYEAEIDSYLDSDEYLASFGENVVPYATCVQTRAGMKTSMFNRTFAVNRGYAANKVGNAARLIGDLAGNLATSIQAPTGSLGSNSNTSKRYVIQASNSVSGTLTRNSVMKYVVDFSQLSQRVQALHRSGAKITSIKECA